MEITCRLTVTPSLSKENKLRRIFAFQVILGKLVKFPATLDEQLQKQLLECSGDLLTAVGDTMCTHDFYEGKKNDVSFNFL